MGKLEDKVALVTGPARGQGEAEARLFAAEHATVMMTDVLDAEASEVARSIGPAASYHRLDVTEEAAWTHMADDIRHGKLDMLVNNAGVLRLGPPCERRSTYCTGAEFIADGGLTAGFNVSDFLGR